MNPAGSLSAQWALYPGGPCGTWELNQGLCLCTSWIPDTFGSILLNYQDFSARCMMATYTSEQRQTDKNLLRISYFLDLNRITVHLEQTTRNSLIHVLAIVLFLEEEERT